MCYGEGEKDNIIDTQKNRDYFVIHFLSNCPTKLRSKWTNFIVFNPRVIDRRQVPILCQVFIMATFCCCLYMDTTALHFVSSNKKASCCKRSETSRHLYTLTIICLFPWVLFTWLDLTVAFICLIWHEIRGSSFCSLGNYPTTLEYENRALCDNFVNHVKWKPIVCTLITSWFFHFISTVVVYRGKKQTASMSKYSNGMFILL